MHLAWAAQVVRREMFVKKFSFHGLFKEGCQSDALPQHFWLWWMGFRKVQTSSYQTPVTASTKASLSLSQVLMFNSFETCMSCRVLCCSSPQLWPGNTLPLYIAMKIHGVTYKRNHIDTLFDFGMCDSYNHLLQLMSNIANGIKQHFTMDGVVCPPKMCNGLFTTAAVATLTTTLVIHQQRIHFMALPFHLCNILHICLPDLTVV